VDGFKNKMFNITYYEARTCTNIINNILPYVPDKKQMNIIGYQLPMIFLANDILTLTGYAGKLCQISVLSSTGSLSSLTLDTAIIYSIFCSNPVEGIDIYDSNHEIIQSQSAALSKKDAMFGAFFDLNHIKQKCNEYGIEFIHSIHVLPGAKTVCLVGNLKTPLASKERHFWMTKRKEKRTQGYT
jgi:hypothetical protein